MFCPRWNRGFYAQQKSVLGMGVLLLDQQDPIPEE